MQNKQDNNKKNRRRQVIVNPAFQWKYSFVVAIAVFLLTYMLGASLYALLHEQARQRIINPSQYTVDVAGSIMVYSLFFSLLTACAAGIWGAVASHRVCGPLYVLEQHLQEVAKGRFPKMRALRKRDNFKGFYESFRDSVAALKEAKKRDTQKLDNSVALAKAALEDPSEDARLTELVNLLESMRAEAYSALGESAPPVNQNVNSARAEMRQATRV